MAEARPRRLSIPGWLRLVLLSAFVCIGFVTARILYVEYWPRYLEIEFPPFPNMVGSDNKMWGIWELKPDRHYYLWREEYDCNGCGKREELVRFFDNELCKMGWERVFHEWFVPNWEREWCSWVLPETRTLPLGPQGFIVYQPANVQGPGADTVCIAFTGPTLGGRHILIGTVNRASDSAFYTIHGAVGGHHCTVTDFTPTAKTPTPWSKR